VLASAIDRDRDVKHEDAAQQVAARELPVERCDDRGDTTFGVDADESIVVAGREHPVLLVPTSDWSGRLRGPDAQPPDVESDTALAKGLGAAMDRGPCSLAPVLLTCGGVRLPSLVESRSPRNPFVRAFAEASGGGAA
jgi:hypothetical protein